MESYYRFQKRVCSKKEEDISIVKNKEEEGSRICKGSVKKEIYLTIEITIDIIGVLCIKEEWKEEENTRLLISKQLDN